MNQGELFSPFDIELGEALKVMGMERSANFKTDLLRLGRKFCESAAYKRINLTATADDATKGFHSIGMPASALGNAAGSLFKERHWIFTGEYRKSKRISNHAHRIMVWKLVQHNEERK